MPPQTGPVVVVTTAPMANSTPPMDGLMEDQATSGLDDATPMLGEAVASPQPSTLESALLASPREGQLGVVTGDEAPTSREAARRLVRFLDEV